MKAFKCDVCEEYFLLKGKQKYRIIRGINVYDTLDLCPNCQKKLDDLVEFNKKKQEEEIENNWDEV